MNSNSMTFSFLILILILLLSSSQPSHSSSSSHDLTSCLLSSGVYNFSVNQNASFFNRILSISIQNLRFSHPSRPLPAAVILPHDLQTLRASILCCRYSFLSIRLRSGGHSYEGLSQISVVRSEFALIDLQSLNSIDVDSVSRTAWLQSGATLGQLYYALAAASNSTHPLAFSAGSCPSVGSGGHIAGGGFGFLSRKYGLAADNVLDAVLVTADGRCLDRTAMGEDLFWAIRGGGGGTWGAVYSWKIQLHIVSDRVSAFIVNRHGSNLRLAELIDAWQRIAPDLPDDLYLSCFVGGSLPESNLNKISVTFKGQYMGPISRAKSIMAERFPELVLLDWEIREMSWVESAVYFSGFRDGSSVDSLLDRELQVKTFFKAKSDYVRTLIELKDIVKMVDLLSAEPKAYLIMDPYGGFMARRKSDDLPFPHRSDVLFGIQHIIEWKDGEDGGRDGYIQWLQDWYAFMGPLVSTEPRAAYVNYLDLGLGFRGRTARIEHDGDPVEEARAWGEKYFLGNYDRLVRVKTAIDPNDVFWNEQSIPPLKLTCDSFENHKYYDFL